MEILILLLLIIAFGGGIYIRAFLTRRAAFKVIEIFYQHGALTTNTAKTLRELGLERMDLLQRMTRPRDYKQSALQVLMRESIISVTEDGRFYMVEEKLDQNFRRQRGAVS